MNKLIISVDGPAGSGKERIAKYISNKYKLYHLDSGILYRRLSLKLIKNKINFDSTKEIYKFIKSIKKLSCRKHPSLRNEKIGKFTSQIAIYPFVREFINNQQHIIVKNLHKKNIGCVIDGRDIGSKVFKNAQIKLFINVNIEIRAKRRHKQLIEQGEKSIYSQILKDIKLRDRTDKNRKASPLMVPNKAIMINNSYCFRDTTIQINNALKYI